MGWIGTIKWILSNPVPLGTSHSAWISSATSIHGFVTAEMALFLGSRLEGAHFILLGIAYRGQWVAMMESPSAREEFYDQDIKKMKMSREFEEFS